LLFVFFGLIKKSIKKPAIKAIRILNAIRPNIVRILPGLDNKTGIASSEVEIKTATSVPAVIILPAYKFDATNENPH
jgi:hypothetical protein